MRVPTRRWRVISKFSGQKGTLVQYDDGSGIVHWPKNTSDISPESLELVLRQHVLATLTGTTGWFDSIEEL